MKKPSCVNFYNPFHLEPTFLGKDSKNGMSFNKFQTGIKAWEINIDGPIPADRILPQLNPNNRIIVGIAGSHVYFYFRGHRIDSSGYPGIKVTSWLKEIDTVYGDIFFIFHDLPEAALAQLQSVVENFNSKSGLSCGHVLCRYLHNAGLIHNPNSFRTDTIFYNFVNSKLQNESVEIVVRSSHIINFLETMKLDYKDAVLKASSIVGASSLAGLLSYIFLVH
ncbi:MAG: hypothetical protein L6Q37_14320 [Bdellovibrionaceae bacterium]|nr:hypothetical protein [Pseudobdellovibrionaceae bacterium]NUM58466.1 hypothetical protein [Pseudobdellovibrionaceae bacterium]